MTEIIRVVPRGGSKSRPAPWMLKRIPELGSFDHFVEACHGSAVFGLSMPRVQVRTFNDYDGQIHNLFVQLRDHGEELARRVSFTPWSRECFQQSKVLRSDVNLSPIDRAYHYLVWAWQAVAPKNVPSVQWKWETRLASKNAELWVNVPERIRQVTARLAGAQITNWDLFELLARIAKYPNVFVYIDPPYKLAYVGEKNYYPNLTDAQHTTLLDLITAPSFKPKVMISHYPDAEYRERLASWKVDSYHNNRMSGQNGLDGRVDTMKREECFWRNY